MASVSVDGGGGRKRSLDSEINMVPMIDLLMVTVSFLLITAVWTHMSRLEGTTQVPGHPDPARTEEVGRLHLDVRGGDQPFHLSFRKGVVVTDGIDVPRDAVHVREGQSELTRYPGLSATLEELSRSHAADLSSADSRVVVMHTDDELRFGDLVAVMDAVAAVKDPNARPARAGQPPEQAFRVSFAAK
ncbi:MAG TPA: biopolymer transporter ExbD [Polyangiaceae bacterium]|nr:biopolymer transporter ExbD [Polyangiaceae bacterium]